MGVLPDVAMTALRTEHGSADLDGLVDRVLARESAAWAALAEAVHPLVLAICKRRYYAPGSAHATDVHHEVALQVLERLHGDDFAALRQWAATRDRYPGARLSAWLGAVAANVLIDQLRASPEFARRRTARGRELAGAADLAWIVRLIMDPAFPADQRTAIALWLRGHDAASIATEVRLDGAAAATRLLHAARERLRRAMRARGEDN
jgi:DNA-directed RNA polymerase specialized sigma24 family protein